MTESPSSTRREADPGKELGVGQIHNASQTLREILVNRTAPNDFGPIRYSIGDPVLDANFSDRFQLSGKAHLPNQITIYVEALFTIDTGELIPDSIFFLNQI